ncbi:MAG TPA: helix-turn-helix domain-containing protein, partial [Isosphaeraceae bacterium]|nr:helix-turn-helix domain-containing protein [Isosphaeraceae bacterium]
MSVVVDCTRRQSGRKALVVQPFAQLPHHIACDPRLSPTDVRVLLALLYYARAKPSCYPGDAAIAARVGRSIPTVQRSLRHLQALGYIDRRPAANATGRLIVLCWRPAADALISDDRPPRSLMIDPPRSSTIEELKKGEEEKRPEAAAGCGSPRP